MIGSRFGIPRVLSSSLSHHALILVAAAILCLPCLLWGIPPGDDASTHVMDQFHFSEQFWHGELYPRWLANANNGFGSPGFFLVYPVPSFTTALLRPLVRFPVGPQREARELGVFFFLVIAGAGFAGRRWFRNHSAAAASTLGAIGYMSLPYVLSQDVYARAALGEVCAFVWMPLALAICDSLGPSVTAVSLLGTVLACLFLSNGIIAVLFVPMLIVYGIGRGPLTFGAAAGRVALLFSALVLGVGIGAIYVFPAVAYRTLFDWGQMAANLPGCELGRYFLYLTNGSLAAAPDIRLAMGGIDVILALLLCGSFAFMVAVLAQAWRATASWTDRTWICVVVGLALLSAVPNLGPQVIRASGWRLSEMGPLRRFTERTFIVSVCTLGMGILAYSRVADARACRRARVLLWVASGAFVFMLPWSAPIWKGLPVLAAIQFPFRLASILSVAAAGLVTLAIDESVGRAKDVKGRRSLLVLAATIVCVIGAGFLTWRVDWNFRLALGLPARGRGQAEAEIRVDQIRATDFQYYRMYVAPRSVEAFARRLRTGPGEGDVNVAASPVESSVLAECVNGAAVVNMRRVGFRELVGSVDCAGDGRVRVNQVYWPLWKLMPTDGATGHAVITSSAEGLIEIALRPGRHELRLVLDREKPERWGAVVSVVSVLSVIVGCGVAWIVRCRSRG